MDQLTDNQNPTEQSRPAGLSSTQRLMKRTLDIVVSFCGLLLFSPVIVVGWILSTISTRKNGFFVHQRIGLHGKKFPMVKLRSMRDVPGVTTTNTARNDVRITRIGRLLRQLKVDELPQLANVLVGHMSLVGPRPDVEGYTDQLEGDDRVLLTIRPGITGPASLTYRHEEKILERASDPEAYNDNVLWPRKVEINCEYIRDWSFAADVGYLWQTVFGYPGTIDPENTIEPPHFVLARQPKVRQKS